MTLFARSPKVVGAHLYAKFGYDEALSQVSMTLTKDSTEENQRFWKNVVNVLQSLHEDEAGGRHPCAALDTKKIAEQLVENQSAVLPN